LNIDKNPCKTHKIGPPIEKSPFPAEVDSEAIPAVIEKSEKSQKDHRKPFFSCNDKRSQKRGQGQQKKKPEEYHGIEKN